MRLLGLGPSKSVSMLHSDLCRNDTSSSFASKGKKMIRITWMKHEEVTSTFLDLSAGPVMFAVMPTQYVVLDPQDGVTFFTHCYIHMYQNRDEICMFSLPPTLPSLIFLSSYQSLSFLSLYFCLFLYTSFCYLQEY